MLRFVADENFKGSIVRGLRRRHRELDILRVQDVGLMQAIDPVVLDWAAEEGRLLLTHDARTITRFAYDRVRAGLPMPGVVEVSQDLPIGRAIEEILILAECSLENEWEGQSVYLPHR
jgi:hypothetical protein